MSIMAIQVNVTWIKPPKGLKEQHDKIKEMQEKLFWDWAYEETGPRLRGEILSQVITGEIMNDMEALLELGCCGNVVFAQNNNKKYPIIKCVMEQGHLVWRAQQYLHTPIIYDPIKGRKI